MDFIILQLIDGIVILIFGGPPQSPLAFKKSPCDPPSIILRPPSDPSFNYSKGGENSES